MRKGFAGGSGEVRNGAKAIRSELIDGVGTIEQVVQSRWPGLQTHEPAPRAGGPPAASAPTDWFGQAPAAAAVLLQDPLIARGHRSLWRECAFAMYAVHLLALAAPFGLAAWFAGGLQGSSVFVRQGEARVRFNSLPFNRCFMTTDWLMAIDWPV